MAFLMTFLAKKYDMVIADSPPLLPTTDALILSPQVDGVVFVCRSGLMNRKMVIRSLKQLENAKANVLGVVLNRVNIEKEGYYKYYQRSTTRSIMTNSVSATEMILFPSSPAYGGIICRFYSCGVQQYASPLIPPRRDAALPAEKIAIFSIGKSIGVFKKTVEGNSLRQTFIKGSTTELPPLKKGDRGGFYNGDKKSPLALLFQRGEYRVLR